MSLEQNEERPQSQGTDSILFVSGEWCTYYFSIENIHDAIP